MLHVLGCGDGVIMAVNPNGNLHWYSYGGHGENDASGSLGWHPHSGNVIGNGWQKFRKVFVFPRAGRPSSRVRIFGVAQNGDLHWYEYTGNGEEDPSGSLGWEPNSGNRIGSGWDSFVHLHGSSNVVFGVKPDGHLLWYSYSGQGEEDPSGTIGWDPNSGNPIGNGWQSMQHVFGGASDGGGFGQVIMAVDQDGKLFWYRYSGNGESDLSGTQGWHHRSGD
ncbi:tachylectin-related carbohydrate-binding protein [Edaphobacter aggregans]|uniref:tachylectin-related carbohydrate-binding protein n=1 Tax=Edaphobacter aggregans TaxID=570835 RepID=UPI00054D771E|nr:tachylectin-related carbohydrate-binding protein [Edaphobacter aggregans]